MGFLIFITISNVFFLGIGFFLGYVKFVPDSPVVIKQQLNKYKRMVTKKTEKAAESEVGVISYKSEKEKEEDRDTLKKQEESVMKDHILEIMRHQDGQETTNY